MQEDSLIHKKRSATGAIVTLVLLFLVGGFVWRVVYFASHIRNGTLNLTDLNFSQTVSGLSKLAAEPPQGETVDVVSKYRPSLGNPDAPVTFVEFADFACPYSRTSSFVMRALAAKFPEQFYYIYRDFPLTDIHPLAKDASEAALCAQDQGKFWEYHDKLYQHQDSIDETSFKKFATQLNLDTERFDACMLAHTHAKQVEQDYEAGLEAGVRGTPTFFVNGNRIPGSIPESILENVILSFQKK